MKKATIIIAVLEAIVLLVLKLVDWKEAKDQKPASAKARRAGGHRVVNPAPEEYNGNPPEGDDSAINILAGSSTSDKNIHEKE